MKIRYILPALIFSAAMPVTAQESTSLKRSDFIAEMDAEFARLDGDGNGKVVKQEVAAAQAAAAKEEALRQNRNVFDKLDQDRNGTLEPAEFAILANPDAIPVDAAPVMAMFDADADGSITLIEYRVATQANFDRADGDRDGVVTPEEMRAAGIAR